MKSRFTSPDSIFIDLKEGDPDVEVDTTRRPVSDESLRARLLHWRLTPETTPARGESLDRMQRLALEQAARHRPLGDSRPLRTVLANLALILDKLGDADAARLVRDELASLNPPAA